MKNKLLKFGRWAEKNWIQIVVIVGLFLMLELALVFFSWFIGYWCNALFGTRFELSSCWAGIGAIGTALGVVVGLGKAAWTKYSTNTAHTDNGLIKSVTDKIGGMGK